MNYTIVFAKSVEKVLKKWKFMSATHFLVLQFGLIALLAGAFLAWTYTKGGKKWLKSL